MLQQNSTACRAAGLRYYQSVSRLARRACTSIVPARYLSMQLQCRDQHSSRPAPSGRARRISWRSRYASSQSRTSLASTNEDLTVTKSKWHRRLRETRLPNTARSHELCFGTRGSINTHTHVRTNGSNFPIVVLALSKTSATNLHVLPAPTFGGQSNGHCLIRILPLSKGRPFPSYTSPYPLDR